MANPFVKARYVEKINQLIKRGEKLTATELKRLETLLREARRNVRDLLLDQPTDWQMAHFDALRQRMELTIGKVDAELMRNVKGYEALRWEQGATWTDEMLSLFGGERALVGVPLDSSLLAPLLDFSADLITKQGAQTIADISTQIQLGILGDKTPFEIMEQVAGTLTDPGVFGSYMTRAEMIVRTEGNRIFDIAQKGRMKQWDKERGGLLKVWQHGGAAVKNPREDHIRAGERYSVGGNPGPIPIDEPFIVGGVPMQYPRDPSAPARQTVACHCSYAPYRPEWGSAEDLELDAA